MSSVVLALAAEGRPGRVSGDLPGRRHREPSGLWGDLYAAAGGEWGAFVSNSGLWVAELLISDRTAQKIRGAHAIEPDELRQAIVCVEGLPWTWNVDAERGGRAIVEATIRGRVALTVLYDALHPLGDTWNLGSVYFVDEA